MATGWWLRGKVKAVPSGDTLVLMGTRKASSLPPEKCLTLTNIVAPRLARRFGTDDEPFAWESREFLRKLCIGQDVIFRVEYVLPTTGREFGTVFLGIQNLADLTVANGLAKVKEQERDQEFNTNSLIAELLRLEKTAKHNGLGCWTKEPKDSIRRLPASSLGKVDAKDYVERNKGKALKAIVERVQNGSTLCVYMLPSFDFVQIYVAGAQAPTMGRRAPTYLPTSSADVDGEDDDVNEVFATSTPLVAVMPPANCYQIPPDQFAREAKHFTETQVLNREVSIVLEGTDNFNNIVGSVCYFDGEGSAKDLALELVENGFANIWN